MKRYFQVFLVLISIAIGTIAMASDFLRVELKNRSAASLKATLSELVGDDVKIIADGTNLILKGEKSALTQLKKIIIDLDIANVSLSVSIYRGVDPNILKGSKGVKKWGTNRVSNRQDVVIVENGQRLVINESKLLVVPVESFGSRFNNIFNADSSLGLDQSQKDTINVALPRMHEGSFFDKSEIVAIENSLFVEPSLFSNKKTTGQASTDSQLKEKVFIRYSVPISSDNSLDNSDANKYTQQEKVLSVQTHIISQRIIHIDEWLKLSGHKVVSYRPSLSANKKVFSTQKNTDSDKSIWIKVDRLN
jgi:hypothetical protein